MVCHPEYYEDPSQEQTVTPLPLSYVRFWHTW
jgi:hypothetical protein